MKKILLAGFLIVCGFSTHTNAQKILISKSSEISFYSKTPIKDIEADNNATTALINLETRDIAIKIPVKSFVFPNKLMQEHFNENYLETEKYPFSTFRGKINEPIDINKNGKLSLTATGKISIHGVEKTQIFKGTGTILNKKVVLDSQFEIALADFNIDIPKIVFEEIAEKVKVTFKILFEEKK